jgi:hypothetical protein
MSLAGQLMLCSTFTSPITDCNTTLYRGILSSVKGQANHSTCELSMRDAPPTEEKEKRTTRHDM